MISLKKTMMILGLVFVVGFFVLPPAQAETYVDREPFDTTYYSICNDEDIDLEGTIQTVAFEKESASGNEQLKYQITVQARGIGQSTGDKYKLTKRFEFHVIDNECPTVFSIDFYGMLIGQGPGNNGRLRIRLSFVQDANCEFRTSIEFLEFECLEEGNTNGI